MRFLILLMLPTLAMANEGLLDRVDELERKVERLESLHEDNPAPTPMPTPASDAELKMFYQSAQVQTLYLNSGNTVKITIPGLPDTVDVNYKTSNATSILSTTQENTLTIVPTGRRVELRAQTLGVLRKVDPIVFDVIKPPKPEIQMLVNGRAFSGMARIAKNSRVSIRLRPSTDFKAKFPRDARYRVGVVKVFAHLSLGAPTLVAQTNTNGQNAERGVSVNLRSSRIRTAPPGTVITVKLENISRVNFEGKSFPVNFSEEERVRNFMLR